MSQRLANQEGVASDAGVQGYKGARWGKETGPQFNREIDSNLRTTCGGGLNLICPSPRLALLAQASVHLFLRRRPRFQCLRKEQMSPALSLTESDLAAPQGISRTRSS